MKFNKSQFEKSTRLNNYEQKLNSILMSKTSLDVNELYNVGGFRNKASLETLREIAKHSNSLHIQDNVIGLLGLFASVTYTISGNGICGVFLAGKSGNTSSGTVHGVAMNGAYSFDISVVHSGGNWTFNTSKILVNDGSKRTLRAPKTSNQSNDVINTQ